MAPAHVPNGLGFAWPRSCVWHRFAQIILRSQARATHSRHEEMRQVRSTHVDTPAQESPKADGESSIVAEVERTNRELESLQSTRASKESVDGVAQDLLSMKASVLDSVVLAQRRRAQLRWFWWRFAFAMSGVVLLGINCDILESPAIPRRWGMYLSQGLEKSLADLIESTLKNEALPKDTYDTVQLQRIVDRWSSPDPTPTTLQLTLASPSS